VIQFEHDCHKLANLVGVPEIKEKDSSRDVKGIVKSWLESEASGNWVLVLDNADNKDDFFSDQLEQHVRDWQNIFQVPAKESL
jgi:hypothetical protein